jgi:myo-inositol catabolism protein IolC
MGVGAVVIRDSQMGLSPNWWPVEPTQRVRGFRHYKRCGNEN